MKFPTGIQQFIQRFSYKTLSFDVFKRIAMVASAFGFIWFLASLEMVPGEIAPIAIFGCIIFSAIALAELFYQSIEHMAAKLSHNSSLYWLGVVILVLTIPYVRADLTRYIVIFSLVMIIRWLLASFAAARRPPG